MFYASVGARQVPTPNLVHCLHPYTPQTSDGSLICPCKRACLPPSRKVRFTRLITSTTVQICQASRDLPFDTNHVLLLPDPILTLDSIVDGEQDLLSRGYHFLKHAAATGAANALSVRRMDSRASIAITVHPYSICFCIL